MLKALARYKLIFFLTLSLALHAVVFMVQQQPTWLPRQGQPGPLAVELVRHENPFTREDIPQADQQNLKNEDPVLTSDEPFTKKENLAIQPAQNIAASSSRSSHQDIHKEKQTAQLEQMPGVETTSSATIDEQALNRILETELARYFYYPRSAQRRNWQGQVILSFMILSDGDISQVKVNKSSGYSVLDHAAVDALHKFEQREQLALAINGHSMSKTLPVTYRLLKH